MGREQRVNHDLEIINTRLADYFGREVSTGEPLHRVVFAGGIVEKRKGNFSVETEGGIFLRDEYGKVKELLKYPYYQDCHVLEMLVPLVNIDSEQKDEIIPEGTSSFSYECFYAFKDKAGTPLPVNWKVIEVIMKFKLYGEKEKFTEKSEQGIIENEDAKHIKYFEEFLGQDDVVTDPKFGVKGIFVPSNYDLKRYGSGRLQNDKLVDNTKVSVQQMSGV